MIARSNKDTQKQVSYRGAAEQIIRAWTTVSFSRQHNTANNPETPPCPFQITTLPLPSYLPESITFLTWWA